MNIQLFEQKQVRSHWDSEQEKWYFAIIDVIAVLTEQSDYQAARNYWKVLKNRLIKEGNETVTNCNRLKMAAADGKNRLTDVADTEQLLRLIQSVPSPKAEPFKQWLAQVGSERLSQMEDPERGIRQALQDYRNLGYSDDWINQRLKSIEIRKELTDEWQRVGVREQQFGVLTNIISQTWSGKTVKQYKEHKGLKTQNLRDNMTGTELILNMLAEASAKDISQAVNPETFDQSKQVAKQGGKVAKVAREELEKQTGKSVVSAENAQTLRGLANQKDKKE
ncbi:Bro-N domain-containing protein [Neisseria leonii]|uniref:BRO family protein n=1 Tax=Neisseria leonii TaxID=2995413 RepID=A0A9X4E1M8_9NEIS|nr:Bro-N domain-containing protein [Neisseria sp. 51.81]MDD9327479.1 BRO family protein [Neisseria sp. 51.81]